MSETDQKSPFEKFLKNMMKGESRLQKVEDIEPKDFQIIMDALICLFFGQDSTKERKVGLEGLANYEGIKIEFSKLIKYPARKNDSIDKYKVIVLPDNDESEEVKQILAKEAIKEFDCLETIEKYELCLRIFHTFSEHELILLAKNHDPLKRDIKSLEARLIQRAQSREEIK